MWKKTIRRLRVLRQGAAPSSLSFSPVASPVPASSPSTVLPPSAQEKDEHDQGEHVDNYDNDEKDAESTTSVDRRVLSVSTASPQPVFANPPVITRISDVSLFAEGSIINQQQREPARTSTDGTSDLAESHCEQLLQRATSNQDYRPLELQPPPHSLLAPSSSKAAVAVTTFLNCNNSNETTRIADREQKSQDHSADTSLVDDNNGGMCAVDDEVNITEEEDTAQKPHVTFSQSTKLTDGPRSGIGLLRTPDVFRNGSAGHTADMVSSERGTMSVAHSLLIFAVFAALACYGWSSVNLGLLSCSPLSFKLKEEVQVQPKLDGFAKIFRRMERKRHTN